MKQYGFTLIELMITVVIVAILASIAYPSYQDSVRKTRRTAAQADLLELASFMERTFTENNSYGDASTALPNLDTEMYIIDFAADQPTATTFIIEAVPIDAQTGDNCGTLTLSNTGDQGADTADCW